MGKVDRDMRINLATIFTTSMQQDAESAGDDIEYAEMLIIDRLRVFNSFIESKIYNVFLEIIKGREASEPARFGEMAGAVAGYLPQAEKKLPTLKPSEGKRNPQLRSRPQKERRRSHCKRKETKEFMSAKHKED